MTKKFYILLLVTFGFLMGPTLNYAQVQKSEMLCCNIESTVNDCCIKKDSDTSEHNCNSSCLGNSCSCPAPICSFSSMNYIETENLSLFSFGESIQNYNYSKIFISSDFRCIWLPPKIS